MENEKIDFIGIGAQKAGTTWLYHSLKKVPGFTLPYVKEINYFSRSERYGKSFLRQKNSYKRILKPIRNYRIIRHLLKIKDHNEFQWYRNWYFSNYTNEWYLSLFDKFDGITGEITPNYSILSIHDIKKINILLPNVKLIFLIRNPIERCISHYFDIRSRKNKNFFLQKFNFDDFTNFMNSHEQEVRSNYIKTLNNYRIVFPEEQILVCFFDAIKENPERLLLDICNFVGYRPKVSMSDIIIRKKINKSKKPEIPERAYSALKLKYFNPIKIMHQEIGGYCTKWYNDLNDEETNPEILFPTKRMGF